MDLGLKNRNAAITGSSMGIGFAIADALAREGCNVAISARGADKLDAAREQLAAHGTQVTAITADFSSESGCKGFVDAVADQFESIDILINNVGGMIPGTLDSLGEADWERVLNVNLMAAVYTTKFALPHLREASNARILNVSGVSGKQLLPGSLTTTIPNAGLIGFSKVMAGELGAAGITVNNICPGLTNTESWGPRAEAMAKVRGVTADDVRAAIAGQTLLGRWADPEEIGNVAAFLVSAKNSYMTGTTIEVCGGFNRYL